MPRGTEADERTPDTWRDRWEGPGFILWRESDAAYFHALWEQVGRDRSRRGRYFGTSPVEATVINALDQGESFL